MEQLSPERDDLVLKVYLKAWEILYPRRGYDRLIDMASPYAVDLPCLDDANDKIPVDENGRYFGIELPPFVDGPDELGEYTLKTDHRLDKGKPPKHIRAAEWRLHCAFHIRHGLEFCLAHFLTLPFSYPVENTIDAFIAHLKALDMLEKILRSVAIEQGLVGSVVTWIIRSKSAVLMADLLTEEAEESKGRVSDAYSSLLRLSQKIAHSKRTDGSLEDVAKEILNDWYISLRNMSAAEQASKLGVTSTAIGRDLLDHLKELSKRAVIEEDAKYFANTYTTELILPHHPLTDPQRHAIIALFDELPRCSGITALRIIEYMRDYGYIDGDGLPLSELEHGDKRDITEDLGLDPKTLSTYLGTKKRPGVFQRKRQELVEII